MESVDPGGERRPHPETSGSARIINEIHDQFLAKNYRYEYQKCTEKPWCNYNKRCVTRTPGKNRVMRKFDAADVHRMRLVNWSTRSSEYVRGMRHFKIYGAELRGD